MTVAAGTVYMMCRTAGLATIDGHSEIPGTAVDDGGDDLFMLFGYVWKPQKVFRCKGFEDLGYGTHGHTSFITELMIR